MYSLADLTQEQFKECLLAILPSILSRERGNISNDYFSVVDYVLECWLGDMEDYEREEEMYPFMDILFLVIKPHYQYEGILYRGMSAQVKTRAKGLGIKRYASYSDQLEIVKHFAGLSEEYGLSVTKNEHREVFKIRVKDAFAFDDFLQDYAEITTSDSLINQIEEKLYENEKIYGFNPCTVTKILESFT